MERLTRLLSDVRKLSDLEERSIERAPVDFPELLDDVVEAARAVLAYGGRHVNLLVTKVPSPLPPINRDRDLLGLALINRIVKSYGEQIEVRSRRDSPHGTFFTVRLPKRGDQVTKL